MLDIILRVCVSTIIDLAAVFAIVTLFAGFMRWKRNKEIILVNIDTMFDTLPIIKRGIMWVENNKDKTLNNYLQAHLSEAIPHPETMIKVIKYQQEGYTLVFYTEMPNSLRIPLAKHLNDWKLVGNLYLNFNNEFGDPVQFRKLCISELLDHHKKSKIVGVIDNFNEVNSEINNYYKEKEIKIC